MIPKGSNKLDKHAMMCEKVERMVQRVCNWDDRYYKMFFDQLYEAHVKREVRKELRKISSNIITDLNGRTIK